MTKYVYSFGNGTADGDGKMKDVLGGKGAGLAEMCRAKLPVPPGFTVSTQVITNCWGQAWPRGPPKHDFRTHSPPREQPPFGTPR